MAQKKKISEKVDKRRRARVRIGTLPDGTPDYRWASGNTVAELEADKKRIEKYYLGGEFVARDQSFDSYAINWLDTYKKDHVDFGTYMMYRGILNNHLIPPFHRRMMGAITANDIQNLLNEKGRALHEKTVGKIAMTASQIFRQAYAEGIIDRDPTIVLKTSGLPSETKRALTEAEVKAALKVASEHKWGLLLMLYYYLGVRMGEALGLRWTDIDFKAKTVHVQRDIDYKINDVGSVKTEASVRYIPLPNPLFDSLSLHRKDDGYVVESPRAHDFISQATYGRIWLSLTVAMYEADPEIENRLVKDKHKKRKDQLKAQTQKKKAEKNKLIDPQEMKKDFAPEPETRRQSILTSHYFRHNYATILHAHGVPVLQARDWLGHTDIQTTINIYTHLDKEKNARKAAEAQDFFK